MSKLKKIYVVCLMMCITIPIVSAQQYELVEKRNFWNEGTNVTGLRMDSVTISFAELYGKNNHGDFRNSYQSDKIWSGGAEARTIVHRDKFSMTGAFSFEHSSGRNMSGSMFIYPEFYPVDILEFTPGRKDLQIYSFMGGIAGDIAPHWRGGGRIDFTSANYSKRKDLRHTNYRLDMTVAPGAMYHKGALAIGLSYIFSKNSESVTAETVGRRDSLYPAFLNKGLMYGTYQNDWQGSGIHLNELGVEGFPVKEIMHGISTQMQWASFYADIEYRYASGTVGGKQIIWFEFPAHRVSSRLGYRLQKRNILHFIRLNINWSHQVNDENILKQKTENGITITYTNGSNRIFEKNILAFTPEYELICPKGELRAKGGVASTEQMVTQMYPYIANQSMVRYHANLSGVFYIGKFDLKGGVAFATGSYDEKKRRVETDLEPGEPPFHLTEYYNLQNEYMTASRMAFNLGLRYNFFQGLYAEINAKYIYAHNLKYISGPSRWCETVKLGYTF